MRSKCLRSVAPPRGTHWCRVCPEASCSWQLQGTEHDPPCGPPRDIWEHVVGKSAASKEHLVSESTLGPPLGENRNDNSTTTVSTGRHRRPPTHTTPPGTPTESHGTSAGEWRNNTYHHKLPHRLTAGIFVLTSFFLLLCLSWTLVV